MAISMAVFSDETVAKIFERANDACERCGRGLDIQVGRGELWSIHHREARGMGGARYRSELALPSNGALLCGSGTSGCHGHVERFRGDAIVDGWLVSRHGIRRAHEVPVRTVSGLVCFTQEGKYAKPE